MGKVFWAFLLAFLFTATPAWAANLLENSNFESATTSPWSSSGGGATATASAELAHGSNYSLKVQHDSTSSYGFQQTVSGIEAGKYYQVTGYATTNSNDTAGYFIRLAWYSSSNASGSQIDPTSETNEITQTNSSWTTIQKTFQAPSNAQSVKVRLVLKSKTTGTIAFTYFDDLIFEQVVDPTPIPEPTATPIPIQNPTSSPTPIKTPTPIKSPTPTKIAIKALAASPTKTNTKEESSPPNLPSSILGTSSADISPTPGEALIKSQTQDSPLKNIFLIGGGIVVILSGVLFSTFIVRGRAEKI